MAQAVSKGFEGSIFPALRARIRWGYIGALGSCIIAAYYFVQENFLLGTMFLVVAPFIPFFDSLTLYQSYLQGKKQFDFFSTSLAVTQFIAVGIVVLTLFFTNNIIYILFAYLASWTLLRLFFLWSSLKRFPPNNKNDLGVVPLGIQSSVVATIATGISSIDQILIFHFIGAAGVAIFAFALAPITQLNGIFRNIPILAMPKLAERSTSSIQVLLKKRLFALAVAGAIGAIIYIFAAEYMYEIFFPQYVESAYYSKILALILIVSTPNTMIGAVVSSRISETPKRLFYLWNIPGFVATLFIILTIQRLGVLSVVVGRLIDNILVLIISFVIWYILIKREKNVTT